MTLLWVIFAILTAAVLAGLALPLYRRGEAARGHELAVYRDQLAELDRDLVRGLIAEKDAEAARNEISRRLLKAEADLAHAPGQGTPGGRRVAFLAAVMAVPAGAVALYVAIGRPDLPDVPRAERLAHAVEQSDFPAMVAQVEAHLARNPADVEGWMVLAPAYRRMGRHGEAAEAFARALTLTTPTAKLHTDLGETLVLANEGVVVERARRAFEDALALDPKDMKARFYRALAAKQEGRGDEALAGFRAMLAEGPADAPWRAAVESQVASLEPAPASSPAAPQLSEEQMAAADGMSAEDRQSMIRGMVDGLAKRLEADGHDLDGWLRLARARMVLGEREAAEAALAAAADHFQGDEASLGRIADARRSLGLEAAR